MFSLGRARHGVTTRRPRAQVAAVGALVLVLAACGSNLDPESVSEARGGSAGSGTSDSGTGDTGGGEVVDGGDVGGGDTGGGDLGGGDTGGGDTGGGDTGGGDTDTPDGPAPTEAPVDTKGIDCDGFKNGPGITDDKIIIGNSADIGGPVPGLFQTAQDGAAAFVAYFNASVPDGICGRKLELKFYDSRADSATDQQVYTAACKEVFAMVGSQSAFDDGGANTAQGCGLPDVRAGAVTFDRNDCTTCFAAQSVNTKFFENAVPDFIKENFPGSEKKAAMFYTDAGAAAINGKAQVKAMERRGMDFKIVQGIGITEFNFAPYVARLKSEGIETVFFITEYSYSVKMRQAMQQQGYTPKVYMRDPTDYNPRFVEQGGSAVDGTIVYTNYVPYEEKNAESDLYEQWLSQVKPGTPPLFFGTFAWSASRLFVELAAKLGGKLSRETLIAELKKVDKWTSNDMHAPQPVGSKGTGECWRFIQLKGGSWKPIDGTAYRCTGLSSTA